MTVALADKQKCVLSYKSSANMKKKSNPARLHFYLEITSDKTFKKKPYFLNPPIQKIYNKINVSVNKIIIIIIIWSNANKNNALSIKCEQQNNKMMTTAFCPVGLGDMNPVQFVLCLFCRKDSESGPDHSGDACGDAHSEMAQCNPLHKITSNVRDNELLLLFRYHLTFWLKSPQNTRI